MIAFPSVPDEAREDVAYLSRSENRLEVLGALSSRELPRRELGELTGVSRTTLGRILAEFEDRGWTRRTSDGNYVATPRGELIADEIEPLFEAIAATRNLGSTVGMLPTEELSISLRHFIDATVRRPDPQAPDVGGTVVAEAIRGASTLSVLTYIAPPRNVGTALQNVAHVDGLDPAFVWTGELVEYVRSHPGEPPDWAHMMREGARVFRYEGRLPCNLVITDGSVLISGAIPDTEEVGTMIESRNGVVRRWARGVFEKYRELSEAVTSEELAG